MFLHMQTEKQAREAKLQRLAESAGRYERETGVFDRTFVEKPVTTTGTVGACMSMVATDLEWYCLRFPLVIFGSCLARTSCIFYLFDLHSFHLPYCTDCRDLQGGWNRGILEGGLACTCDGEKLFPVGIPKAPASFIGGINN
jgi:hypothetical protein